jgi:Zn-dependent protease
MDMNQIIYRLAVSAPVFLLAITLHEYAHGRVALMFGDNTAESEGRLTLNPTSHIDPFGTIILPLILLVVGGGIFGYAKPVPVNPTRYKNIKWGIFWVSFAGPLANIILAIISAFALSAIIIHVPETVEMKRAIIDIARASVLINVILAVFNLIPWPPLDGSRMLSTFLDYNTKIKYEQLERFTIFFFVALWMTNLFSYLAAPAFWLTSQLTLLFHSILL